jgi:glucose-1-phosphate thymidylyltransferase
MLAGIREILLISTKEDIPMYKKLLGTGEQIGLEIEYAIQEKPNGLAEAFIIGEEFIGEEKVALILGDNIFFGQAFSRNLEEATKIDEGAYIFGYYVKNPEEFGVLEFDQENNVLAIEEKPINPKSNYVVPGIYFYDNTVVEKAKNLKPSKRGELEITDLNRVYLSEKKLKMGLLGRGLAWLDTGTHNSLLEASNFVAAVQNRQGLYIACIEEIAYRKGYIDKEQLKAIGEKLKKTDYGKYLLELAEKN